MTTETTPSEQDVDTLRRRLSRLAHSLNRPSRLTLLSYALCAPLLFFLGVFFLLPLLYVLHTSLYNPVIGGAWPGIDDSNICLICSLIITVCVKVLEKAFRESIGV